MLLARYQKTSSRADFLELGGTLPETTVSVVIKGDGGAEETVEVTLGDLDDETGASLLAKIAKRKKARALEEIDAELEGLTAKRRRLEEELEVWLACLLD